MNGLVSLSKCSFESTVQCFATYRKEIILKKAKAELEKSEGDCDKGKQQVTPFNKSSGAAVPRDFLNDEEIFIHPFDF